MSVCPLYLLIKLTLGVCRLPRVRPPDLLRAAAGPAPHQHHIPASREEKWKNVSFIKIIDLIKMPRSWNTTEHQLNQLKFLNVERYISYFIYLTMPNAQTIVIFGSSKSSSLLNLHVSPAVPPLFALSGRKCPCVPRLIKSRILWFPLIWLRQLTRQARKKTIQFTHVLQKAFSSLKFFLHF